MNPVAAAAVDSEQNAPRLPLQKCCCGSSSSSSTTSSHFIVQNRAGQSATTLPPLLVLPPRVLCFLLDTLIRLVAPVVLPICSSVPLFGSLFLPGVSRWWRGGAKTTEGRSTSRSRYCRLACRIFPLGDEIGWNEASNNTTQDSRCCVVSASLLACSLPIYRSTHSRFVLSFFHTWDVRLLQYTMVYWLCPASATSRRVVPRWVSFPASGIKQGLSCPQE